MMDPSQILPNLFVGSYPRSPEDIDRLKQDFGITAVLNVQTESGAKASAGSSWPSFVP
jgi:hypothetical protein